MNHLEDDLRAQMRAATAGDVLPPDLLGRVHRGVRRSRARRAAVAGTALAVAGASVGTALLSGGGEAPTDRQVVATAPSPAVAGVPGPSDEELRAAQWWHYESVPEQPGTERSRESRWESRDGRHLALQPDGTLEQYSDRSVFSYGEQGATFEQLLALAPDRAALEQVLRSASGGRPVEERVLEQVAYLLGRSPALLDVRRALFDVAAGLDGATVERGSDGRGRPADVLRRTDRDGAVQELYVDPGSGRLLQERLVAGPEFPTPPTDGPVPSDQPAYETGQVLYSEVFERWSTEPPPTG